MRAIAVCAVLLTLGMLVCTSVGAGGDPAPFVLTARIVRGVVENLPPSEPGSFRVLDEKELAEFLRAFDAVPGGEAVARVTTGLPGKTAYEFSLTDLERVSYVADFDETIGSGGVPQPIRRTINEGTILDVKATPSPEGTTVTFDLRLTRAILVRPIPTFSTSLSGPPVTIELPELRVRRVKESITVPANRWAGLRAAPDTLILLGALTAPPGGAGSDLAPDRPPR